MSTNSQIHAHSCDLNGEESWSKRLPKLQQRAEHWIFAASVKSWRGQERELAQDVVQETAIRTLERSRRAELGQAEPIDEPEHMIVVIELNYCRDLRRHDLKLVRSLPDDYLSGEELVIHRQDILDPEEIAIENAFRDSLFCWVAEEIAHFPEKEKNALLTDLANRMSFDVEPTALQFAFQKAGIRIQDFQQPLPDDPVERSRYTSNLSLAYKRLKNLPRRPQYNPAA